MRSNDYALEKVLNIYIIRYNKIVHLCTFVYRIDIIFKYYNILLCLSINMITYIDIRCD